MLVIGGKETSEKLSSTKKKIEFLPVCAIYLSCNTANERFLVDESGDISTRNTWNIDNNRSSNGAPTNRFSDKLDRQREDADRVHQSLKRDFVEKLVTRFSVSLWPLLRVLLSISFLYVCWNSSNKYGNTFPREYFIQKYCSVLRM